MSDIKRISEAMGELRDAVADYNRDLMEEGMKTVELGGLTLPSMVLAPPPLISSLKIEFKSAGITGGPAVEFKVPLKKE